MRDALAKSLQATRLRKAIDVTYDLIRVGRWAQASLDEGAGRHGASRVQPLRRLSRARERCRSACLQHGGVREVRGEQTR